MSLDSSVADTPLGIACLFNEYFHSVYNPNSTTAISPPTSIPECSLSTIDISMHDVFMVLSFLDCAKAIGGDGIPPATLNGAATAILEPLHHLFDLCIKRAVIPSEWHDHFITPIP